MKEYIEERAIEIAYYIIEHKATVRQTARQFEHYTQGCDREASYS